MPDIAIINATTDFDIRKAPFSQSSTEVGKELGWQQVIVELPNGMILSVIRGDSHLGLSTSDVYDTMLYNGVLDGTSEFHTEFNPLTADQVNDLVHHYLNKAKLIGP